MRLDGDQFSSPDINSITVRPIKMSSDVIALKDGGQFFVKDNEPLIDIESLDNKLFLVGWSDNGANNLKCF